MNTSGTSGKYLQMIWDRHDYFKCNMSAAFFRNKYYGILPSDHCLTFFSTLYYENKICYENPQYRYDKSGRQLMINKAYLNKIDDIQDVIQSFSPVWMIVQPSVLMLLHEMNCEWLYNLSYIETIGEFLLDSQRSIIESTYNAKVVNNYGTTETSYIAMECPYGRKHLLEDNVYVEIDAQDCDDVGDIVVTNLQNKAMPIIRYRNGDRGRMINEACACGCQSPRIELCDGRIADYIVDGGKKISWYPLLNTFNCVNDEYILAIRQLRIIQSEAQKLSFHIVLSSRYIGWEENIKNSICNLIKNRVIMETLI